MESPKVRKSQRKATRTRGLTVQRQNELSFFKFLTYSEVGELLNISRNMVMKYVKLGLMRVVNLPSVDTHSKSPTAKLTHKLKRISQREFRRFVRKYTVDESIPVAPQIEEED